jgi:hypothetical protein
MTSKLCLQLSMFNIVGQWLIIVFLMLATSARYGLRLISVLSVCQTAAT